MIRKNKLFILRELLNYLKGYQKIFIFILFCIGIGTFLNLSIPYFIKNFIDIGWESKDIRYMRNIIIMIAIILCLRKVFSSLQGYYSIFISQKIMVQLQNQLHSHLQNLPLSFFEKQKVGEIMSTVNDDVKMLQNVIAYDMMELLIAFITLISGIGLAFYLNWKLTIFVLLIIPIVSLFTYLVGEKLRTLQGIARKKIADLMVILEQSISGIKVIHSFCRKDYEVKRFKKENEGIFKYIMKIAIFKHTVHPFTTLFLEICVLIIIWFGVTQIIREEVTTGTLYAFFGYMCLIAIAMNNFGFVYLSIQEGLASAERVFGLLEEKNELCEIQNAISIPNINWQIEFKNVYFNYNSNEKVLNNVTFTINSGEIVALVGPSAVGKTTIVDLIPRFYDPIEGEILIDGIDIKKVKLECLRKQIGIVHQDVFLFNRSIKENIAYGKLDASFDEIIESAKIADAHVFISKLPDGYDTIVGERGVRLSGGQKQKIAIARAIISKPRILILDEATSSLDAEAEAIVQERLYHFIKENNITTIVIAHRLSTILFADRILVVKDGKVVEEGTHKELIENAEIYQRLYKKQIEMFA